MCNCVKELTALLCLIPCVLVAQQAAASIHDEDQSSPWHFKRELELTYEYERNLNLDSKDDENETVLEPKLTLGVGYAPSELFQTFVQLELVKEYGVSGPEAENQPTELEISELYVLSEGIDAPWGGEFSVQLGRQRFDDERKWLYDEQLDGLRLFYDYGSWNTAISATRESSKEVLRHKNKDETDNYMVSSSYEFDDHILGAYIVKRHQRKDGDERPLFLGIQAYGELNDSWQYWVELARVRGSDGEEDIRGWGFDTGAVYTFDLPLKPRLILGHAYGSGDTDTDDGVNKAFRQTGLQDNEYDFDGTLDFRYHGVLLEPELSNMRVWTLGVGINPSERFSTYLLYHRYSQDKASDELRDTNLDADPNGEDRELGSEIDWVLGAELTDALEMEFVLGYFMPGEAFDDDSDDAFFAGLEFEYAF